MFRRMAFLVAIAISAPLSVAMIPKTNLIPIPQVDNLSGLIHPATVFREDSRQVLNDRESPWGAAGKLVGPNGSCTAALVGRNLILTNAHCVTDADGRGIVTGDYTFYAGYNGTHGGGNRWTESTKIRHLYVGTTSHKDFDNDWAILITAWNIGDKVGWFGTQNLDSESAMKISKSHHLYTITYPSDLSNAQVPYWEKDCEFQEVYAGGGLLHNCSTSSGASGGPMFYWDMKDGKKASRIIAVNAGEGRNGAKRSVIGVPYSREYSNIAVPARKWFGTLVELKKSAGS